MSAWAFTWLISLNILPETRLLFKESKRKAVSKILCPPTPTLEEPGYWRILFVIVNFKSFLFCIFRF